MCEERKGGIEPERWMIQRDKKLIVACVFAKWNGNDHFNVNKNEPYKYLYVFILYCIFDPTYSNVQQRQPDLLGLQIYQMPVGFIMTEPSLALDLVACPHPRPNRFPHMLLLFPVPPLLCITLLLVMSCLSFVHLIQMRVIITCDQTASGRSGVTGSEGSCSRLELLVHLIMKIWPCTIKTKDHIWDTL